MYVNEFDGRGFGVGVKLGCRAGTDLLACCCVGTFVLEV